MLETQTVHEQADLRLISIVSTVVPVTYRRPEHVVETVCRCLRVIHLLQTSCTFPKRFPRRARFSALVLGL